MMMLVPNRSGSILDSRSKVMILITRALLATIASLVISCSSNEPSHASQKLPIPLQQALSAIVLLETSDSVESCQKLQESFKLWFESVPGLDDNIRRAYTKSIGTCNSLDSTFKFAFLVSNDTCRIAWQELYEKYSRVASTTKLELAKRLLFSASMQKFTSRRDSSISKFKEALEFAYVVPDMDTVALIMPLTHLADVYAALGRYDSATTYYTRALAYRETQGDSTSVEVQKLYWGIVSSDFNAGDYSTASQNSSLLLSHISTIKDTSWAIYSSLNLAALAEENLGHPEEMLRIRHRIMQLHDATDYKFWDIAAENCYNVGLFQLSHGLIDIAEVNLRNAIRLWLKDTDSYCGRAAVAMSSLGAVYATKGNFEKALTCYSEANRIAKSNPKAPYSYEATSLALFGLAEIRLRSGQFSLADSLLQEFDSLRKSTETIKEYELVGATQLAAESQFLQGNIAAADSLVRSLDSLYQNSDGFLSSRIRMLILDGRASLGMQMGDTAIARKIQWKIVSHGRMMFKQLLPVLTESEAIKALGCEGFALDNYLGTFQSLTYLVDNYADSVAEFLIDGRGLVFDELAARRRRHGLAIVEADSTHKMLTHLRHELSSAYYDESGSPPRDSVSSLFARIAELELNSARALKGKQVLPTSLLSIESVRSKLPPNSVLVQFNRSWKHSVHNQDSSMYYYVLIVTPKGHAKFQELGDCGQIDAQIEVYQEHMSELFRRGSPTAKDDSAYSTLARNLYARIWQPIEPHLSEQTQTFVIPESRIYDIPLATLKDNEDQYLVERYTFQYLSSARDLMRPDESKNVNSGILVLGDPDFNRRCDSPVTPSQNTTVEFASRTGSQAMNLRKALVDCESIRNLVAAPLPASRLEIEAIASHFSDGGGERVTKLEGCSASEAALCSCIVSARIAHIATHGFNISTACLENSRDKDSLSLGFFSTINPLLRSGLILAGANRDFSSETDDGIVTALDILGMDLTGTEVVTLSACQTAKGVAIEREGLFGLQRAFLLAGANVVVSSVWPLIDSESADLMSELYVTDNISISARLRALQLERLDKSRRAGKSTHPLTWGGFLITGAN